MLRDELRSKLDEIDSDLALLNAKGVLNKGEQERWDRTVRQRTRIDAQLRELEERDDRVGDLRRRMESGEIRMENGTPYSATTRADVNLAQASALRCVEANAGSLSSSSMDRLDYLIRSSGQADASFFARYVEIHGRPEYNTAFGKIAMNANPGFAASILNESERSALADSYALMHERAQSESPGSGGYAVPVLIDPSIIVTTQENDNPFLRIARTVDVNTNAWKGVSSAGVSWSFDAEAAEVSDDSLTSLVQPTVTVFMARGFIPYSIEISEDWEGFAAEMARVLAIGYDDLLLSKFTSGSGTGEPRGILTALAAASPTVTVTSVTDGAFGQEDVFSTWNALPQKYRRNASWMMSVSCQAKIRQMGTLTNWFATTVNLTEGAVDRLFNRDVYENTYFPDITNLTSGAQNRMVLGDFQQFVIARRTGLQVELVPQLFSTNAGRPTGQRGWFAFGRLGANSVADNSFRLQANT
jgi:HK97 family phage major capsid protein